MKKKIFVILFLVISLIFVSTKNYTFEDTNIKEEKTVSFLINNKEVAVKKSAYDAASLPQLFIDFIYRIFDIVREIYAKLNGGGTIEPPKPEPPVDVSLTTTVKKILSDNNKNWINNPNNKSYDKLSCTDAGLDDSIVTNHTKVACLAWTQVGRTNIDCCDFVKEIRGLAGLAKECYKDNNSTKAKQPGYTMQWGESGCHVAIYISDNIVISGGMGASKGLKNVTKNSLAQIKDYANCSDQFKGYHS